MFYFLFQQSIICSKCRSVFKEKALSKLTLERLVHAGLTCEGMTKTDDQMLWYAGQAAPDEDIWPEQKVKVKLFIMVIIMFICKQS